MQTASANFTWTDVVERYFNLFPEIYAVTHSSFLNETGACLVGQGAEGIWFGGYHPPYGNCTLDSGIFQLAVLPIGEFIYFQADNVGAFANPVAAERLCATGPVDTPEDDMLVVAVDGIVAYNQSASNGGVNATLAMTDQFEFSWDISNTTQAGKLNQITLATNTPNFPNPAETVADAFMYTAATLADPTLAAPPNGTAPAYPNFWVFQGFAGGHFLAVDLTTAPSSFNISTLDYLYTANVSSRATADSCALCGMCPPGESCPLNTTAFPENPPDFCETQTAAISNISGDQPIDGLGPFTWSISVV
ncbi:TPA: hypothetical protein ACH3X1_009106 [Trebouxia sp. C0004]